MKFSRRLSGGIDLSNGHYALYRFSQDTKILWVSSIDHGLDFFKDGVGLTFDEQGNAVVIGNQYSSEDPFSAQVGCNSLFVDVIDIETGSLLKSPYLSPADQFTLSISVVRIDNGYVVQTVLNNCTRTNSANPTEPFDQAGELLFLDNNLEFVKKIEVARPVYNGGLRNLIQTRDGGYVTGYTTFTDNNSNRGAMIIKTDQNGVLKWSYIEPNSEIGSGFLETDDGGIVFAPALKSFDSFGEKWILIKLNKDGKLD